MALTMWCVLSLIVACAGIRLITRRMMRMQTTPRRRADRPQRLSLARAAKCLRKQIYRYVLRNFVHFFANTPLNVQEVDDED